jgi:Flp pilus assembly protein TadB
MPSKKNASDLSRQKGKGKSKDEYRIVTIGPPWHPQAQAFRNSQKKQNRMVLRFREWFRSLPLLLRIIIGAILGILFIILALRVLMMALLMLLLLAPLLAIVGLGKASELEKDIRAKEEEDEYYNNPRMGGHSRGSHRL